MGHCQLDLSLHKAKNHLTSIIQYIVHISLNARILELLAVDV